MRNDTMSITYNPGLDLTFLTEDAMGGDFSSALMVLLADLKTAAYLMEILHWTYRGENFVEMHEFFGNCVYSLGRSADAVAELAMIHDPAALKMIPDSLGAIATMACPAVRAAPPTIPGAIEVLKHIHAACNAITAFQSDAAVQDAIGRLASEITTLSWKLSSSQKTPETPA